MSDPAPGAGLSRAATPLLIGVTGKRDLKSADAAVRAAMDLAFNRIDARCPDTPKVLVSSLAAGADTVAAEAALSRPDWSVVAPLPFGAELYLDDFDEAGAERLKRLLADPRVRTLVLEPLNKPGRDTQPYVADELARSDSANPARTEHYEQAGLFIAERVAVLMAVMEADETPGRIGGAARIVRHRLDGELDAAAAAIARRSEVLLEPPRLVDRRTGPVWLLDLARLVWAPTAPADALLVWNPGCEAPSPLGDNGPTRDSLRLADSLEAMNHAVGRIGADAWSAVERQAGSHDGDAASEIRRARAAMSAVQRQMVFRVRFSILALAVLSCAAILTFEVYVALAPRAQTEGWRSLLSLIYSLLVIGAIGLYWYAGRQKWQRVAEDYRAAAEALRVQLVWWSSGMLRRADRVERYYLHGAHGSLRQLRALVEHLVDSAMMRLAPPPAEAGAAEAWINGQIDFFDRRIGARRWQLGLVEGASWFLFAASLCIAIGLALSQFDPRLMALELAPAGWSAWAEGGVTSGCLVGFVALFLLALRIAPSPETEMSTAGPETPLLVGIVGAIGGVVLTVALCAGSAFFTRPGPPPGVAAPAAPSKSIAAPSGPAEPVAAKIAPPRPITAGAAAQSPAQTEAAVGANTPTTKCVSPQPADAARRLLRELIAIAVSLPAAIAGALRFVADKSSWAAELSGYEHAREHFKRGRAALAAADGHAGDRAAERREIVLALGVEALGENEAWLRSHRERPLEPVVGG